MHRNHIFWDVVKAFWEKVKKTLKSRGLMNKKNRIVV